MATRVSRVLQSPAPATCGPWADRARNGRSDPGCTATLRGPSRLRRSQGMSRTKRWSPLAVLGSVAIVFAACSGSASPSPSSAAPTTAASAPAASQAASAAPFTATAYPTSGDAPCGVAPYTGEFKKISALDAKTVEFQLCNPDVAFLSKIAFTAFAIEDSDYLDAHAADKSLLEK